MKSLDLFAGPGGWDEGLRPLGLEPLGVEWDARACATREAAGHPTLQADVAELEPRDFAGTELLLASPPCQAFSTAGKGEGRASVDDLLELAASMVRGTDRRAEFAERVDPRALLVVEPLRFALALRPKWVVFEQVPPVLPLWERFAAYLRWVGYSTWTGKVSAEQYGVPQTRKRAILMASLDGTVAPPTPTHLAYKKGEPNEARDGLLPWVSMADALGWGATERPYPTLAGGTTGGPCYDFLGGSGARKTMLGERRERRWAWPYTAPATTVAGDPRITARCHHEAGSQGKGAKTTAQVQAGEYEGTEPIRLTAAEASILQSFPADYPWQGTKTSIHLQVGNAVPPLMARAVVGALVGASLSKEQAA